MQDRRFLRLSRTAQILLVSVSVTCAFTSTVAYGAVTPLDSNPTYEWHITGTGPTFISQGPWNDGPIGWGPGILQFSQTVTVSNGVTGQIYVSANDISGVVGWNVGYDSTYTYSYTETTGFQLSVPSNRKYEIIWRNDYLCRYVYQQEYVVNHPGGSWPVGSPVACTAYSWKRFEYSHRDVTNS